MTGSADRDVLVFSGFTLDPAKRTLTGPDGAAIDLKPKVFDTLAALAARPGEVIAKRELMEAVWPGVVVEENNLNQAVSALRKALGDGKARDGRQGNDRSGRPDGGRRLIVTVPGRGYQFIPERPAPSALAAIAVLPFEDISAGHDQAHLCRGMTDELLTHLRRIEDIGIAGGEWVRALMAQDADPRLLGEKLAVTHLLEGSIRHDGAHLRVSARLVGASDGFLVWSEEYDRDLADLLDAQARIAAAVADALRLALRLSALPGPDDAEQAARRAARDRLRQP